ncbi:MAG TPA: hypothetical protein PLE99_07500 [Candidatus Thiothrix moscowensis]|uniref:ELWxxDGT repeat protein n=1 Tax=unclassified Thiothrix TaxID=2636184 RepID=UPI002600E154|nr:MULTISPECIES: ELWxxDGT repeat protein [unclassified Thiothrix]HRJ52595.1 hypothetical protein [Candidatus Thiothrix moscowensis]HRJ92921.1 hypothetical protein [Candidatus Thiothrix moscowensis]
MKSISPFHSYHPLTYSPAYSGATGHHRVTQRATAAIKALLSWLLLLLVLFLSLPAQAELSSIDIRSGSGSSGPREFTVYNNKLYFVAEGGDGGTALWFIDATQMPQQVAKIKRLYDLTVYNNKLYFSALDYNENYGQELWVSDGTASGTKMLKDIREYAQGSSPSSFAVYNNKLYFSANDGINGSELWVSDGTAEGTKLVKDIKPGGSSGHESSTSGWYSRHMTVYNNKLYFQADDGTNGSELWESDGTAEGTKLVKDIKPGSGGGEPFDLTVYNNKLYFQADDGTNGFELWESNGTADGTKLVKDIQPGLGEGSRPHPFTVYNNKLYFQADDGIHGEELWESDGTADGTKLLKDINEGISDGRVENLTVYNNKLYFTADAGYGIGLELWVSDGTASGTMLVKDIWPGRDIGSDNSSYPFYFAVYNNKLYFSAEGPYIGRELWAFSPLQVTAQTPANGATGVAATTSSLRLTFGEAVTAKTGSIIVYKASDNSQVDTIDVATSGVTVNGQTATISLLANVLSPNTGYYVTVAAGAFNGATSGVFSGLSGSNAWTFTTGKGNQTVTFDAATPTNKTLGDAAFSVTITASSGLTPTLGSSTTDVCTVSGNTVTLVAVGTCTLTASQEGNDSYNAAAQVTKDITVSLAKLNQTVAFDANTPTSKTLGDAAFSVTITASSSLTPTLGSSTTNVCTVSGSSVTLLAAGTCTLTASQAGNDRYNAAAQVTKDITVAKGNQTVAFDVNTPTNKTLGDAAFSVTTTASSGLTPTLGSSTTNVCTVSGSTVTLLAAGTCTLTASHAGNANYNAAAQVTKDITVAKGNQIVAFDANTPTNKTLGDAAFTVTTTGGASDNAVTLGSSTTGVCTVFGSTVTLLTAGTCTLIANQEGNANYNAAAQATKDITVAKGNQTVTFDAATPTSKTLGDAAFSVTITASSGLTPTLGSSTASVCTVSGNTVTLVALGTCTLTANQAGNTDYHAAAQATKDITVKTNQTVAFDAATPTSKTLGDAPFSVTTTASSGLTPTLGSSTTNVCSVSSNTVTLLAAGTCTLTANQAGNANYNAAAQATKDITVTAQSTAGDTTVTISKGNIQNLREESTSGYTIGKPSDMAFNSGAYSYRIVGLSTTTPETVTTSLTFDSPIPTGAKLYKVSNTGYTEITGAILSGNTATFSITDNGSLDTNPALGTIDDPVALGVPASSGGTASSGGGGSFDWLELLFAFSIMGATLRRRINV